MAKTILFGAKNGFFKGNMHCHSSNSDGKYTPYELKKIYKEAGYSFLAITDHEHLIDNSYLNDNDFITITSCEIAIKQFADISTLKNYNMKVCHLNLYAKDPKNVINVCYNSVYDHFSKGENRENIKTLSGEYERRYGADGINDIIKIANDNGFFVCYNHPRWSLENYGDYNGYNGLWGVEIFNYSSGVVGIYDYNINVFDDFLRDGKRVFASNGDDNHNRGNKNDSFGAFVVVNTDTLDYDSIINGLLKGDFYPSSGPEINQIAVENGIVTIKCTSAKQICLSTMGRRSDSVIGEDLTEADFKLKDTDGYFRITVIDDKGRRADSQAYFLADF